jgi:hypothetical protein
VANQAGNGTYQAAPTQTRTFTVGPPTPAPAQVVATAGVAQISVQWQAPGDTSGVTGYLATATPGEATCETSSASDTSCVMGGVAGTTYTVKVVTRSAMGDSVATSPSNAVTPTAPPISTTVPSTNLTLTTDKGIITTAVPSQDIVVIGTGFMPYSTAKIIIYSLPIDLGSAVTDGAGNFSKPVTVPANIGLKEPTGPFSPIHTHDTSGIVHMEADQEYPFTIGQFFAVWGVKFSDDQLGPYRAKGDQKLSAYVNGKKVSDPVNYVMKEHDVISVGYGKQGSFPTNPPANFPAGL